MNKIEIIIDGAIRSVEQDQSLRRALLSTGAYIPGICDHPDLNSFKPFNWSERVWQGTKMVETDQVHHDNETTDQAYRHCDLCLVSINGGKPQRSCDTTVAEGMSIETSTPEVISSRRSSLKRILSRHPHACLTCPQRHGCDRIQCSMNVPVQERCCELLGRCEIGKVTDWIGIPNDTPAYHHEGRPQIKDEPLFLRDYELCIGCTRCVRVCRDVRGVDILGAVLSNDFPVVGTTGGPTLEESLCRFCGACVEVCPTGALRDHSDTKPLVQSMAPCSARCPLNIDVPGYMDLIAEGDNLAALELIRERAVLPGVLGYACFHPCEANCRRDALDGAASICALKRYVSDVAGDEPPRILKKESTGKRVVVIGGGPAGLATSADLLRAGHQVVVLDSANDLGGMLRQTLPDFRLPDGVIDRDLKYLFDLGLETNLGRTFGDSVTLTDLRAEGFQAIVVAVGLGESIRLNVPGEDLTQVSNSLYFLQQASRGIGENLGGRVVVIGGGAVAIDAAMTARRLGSTEVRIICLESEAEMPAHPDEIRFAREEGIEILNGWGVVRFDASSGGGVKVLLKKCLTVFNEQGRFNPVYNTGIELKIDTEWVVVAIGQRKGIDLKELESSPDVFLAGDIRQGATSIVEAMADGRKVAVEVDKYLGGNGQFDSPQRNSNKSFIGKDESFHLRKRTQPVFVDPVIRVQSMSPFIPTMTPEEALSEARRCLRCHLRARITPSVLPPDPWQRYEADLLSTIPHAEGVMILADDQKKTIRIVGSPDLNQAFQAFLNEDLTAEYCHWEIDPMFTKRESELIQAHLQAFGEMPGSGDLDDLF